MIDVPRPGQVQIFEASKGDIKTPVSQPPTDNTRRTPQADRGKPQIPAVNPPNPLGPQVTPGKPRILPSNG